MRTDRRAAAFPQLRREIPRQLAGEHLLIRQIGFQQFVLERQLDVCHQRREFRRGEADADLEPPRNLLLRGQRFEYAVEPALGREIFDLVGVYRYEPRGAGTLGALARVVRIKSFW